MIQKQEYLQLSGTLSPTPQLNTIIGNKGSGKNTYVTLVTQMVKQKFPWVPVFANAHIEGAIFIPNILKWLAEKLIIEDRVYCEVIIDEGALSGLEARGSYAESRALDSYLFTLSRKVNCNIWLITQLMSMIEKRAQWTGDVFILCEVHYLEDGETIDYFLYKIFDSNFRKIDQFDIDGWFANEFLFPRFKTEEIPFQDELSERFKRYYEIDETDLTEFEMIMERFR